MTAGALLEKYKYRPQLEKRHEQIKTVRVVAAVFLKSVAHIEALLLIYFLALLLDALIEREMRRAMAARKIKSLPLYPEARLCRAPTTDGLLELFAAVQHHQFARQERVVQVFDPQFDDLQLQVLDLLSVPHSAYTTRR